jgi:CBS domain-containing protein
MTARRFRHLPVVSGAGLIGMLDISDVCRALLAIDDSQTPATGTAAPE